MEECQHALLLTNVPLKYIYLMRDADTVHGGAIVAKQMPSGLGSTDSTWC